MSNQQPNKIIPVTTQSEPDGPHGICFRTMGVQVVIGTAANSHLTGVPSGPQPIPIATAAPCLGERCHAWDSRRKKCVFVLEAEQVISRPSPLEMVLPYLDAMLTYFKVDIKKPDLGPGLFDKPDPTKP